MSDDSDRETKPFKFVTAGMCRSYSSPIIDMDDELTDVDRL